MNCKSCGNSNVADSIVYGYSVKECQVCGYLYGESTILKKIEELNKAKEMGIDPVIYPLHTLLSKVANFKIDRKSVV